MGRIRTAAVGGFVDDNPLAAAATTLNSAGLASLPLFAAGDFAVIMFDPNGRTGEPFAKRLTVHGTNATSATMDAAAIYGTARELKQKTPWRLTNILDQDGNGAGLLAITKYYPGTDGGFNTSSTTPVVVDATNAKVNFVAPPSGKVIHRAWVSHYKGTAAGWAGLAIMDNTNTLVAGSKKRTVYSGSSQATSGRSYEWMETGLTPGTSYERRLAAFSEAGSIGLEYGPAAGDLTMTVSAVNV